MNKISLNNNYNKYILTLLLFLLYSIQGLFFGFSEALKIILVSKNSSYNQIALLELTLVPVYLKFLFSPIIETYYIKKYGKRMGYIGLFSILIFFLFIYFALNLETLVNNLNVEQISFLMIIMSFFISIQDINIDSLSEENFKEKDNYLGILMQTFGQIVGPIISFNLFLFFYNNNYDNIFYYFCLGFAIFIILSTILTFILLKEQEPKYENNNPMELYYNLPNFYNNKILFKYLLHLITFSIGLNFFNSTLLIKSIKKGFKEEDINKIQYSLIPLEFLNFYILSKMNISKNIFIKYKNIIFFYIIYVIISFMNFMFFDKDIISYNSFFYLTIITGLFSIIRGMEFSVKSNFNVMSCDKKMGSCYLSTMNSLSNIPGQFYKPIFMFLMGKFNYYHLSLFFILYSIIYYIFITIPFCNKYNNYNRENYSISNIKNKKIN